MPDNMDCHVCNKPFHEQNTQTAKNYFPPLLLKLDVSPETGTTPVLDENTNGIIS